jgi:hypothetical protein
MLVAVCFLWVCCATAVLSRSIALFIFGVRACNVIVERRHRLLRLLCTYIFFLACVADPLGEARGVVHMLL